MTGAVNMPSTKKRLRSPDVDGLSSMRQSVSIRTHQSAPAKRRSRGPKDNRIKALEKLKRRHRYQVFQGTADNPNTACDSQLNTRVHRMAPASVDSPLQRSPGPAVPYSPQLTQMLADGVLHRILAEDIVYLRVLPSRRTVSRNGLLPLCPGPPNARLRY